MYRKQTGITFTEVVICMSVIAVLLGLSGPSFTKFSDKRKVAAAANEISSFFENVKMESVKRNQYASITLRKDSDTGDWCMGAVLGENVSCDCMATTPECTIDSSPMLLSSSSFTEFEDVSASFTPVTTSFDPIRGILADPSKTVTVEIEQPSRDFKVDVSINATGSVKKCTPSDHRMVGYSTCI